MTIIRFITLRGKLLQVRLQNRVCKEIKGGKKEDWCHGLLQRQRPWVGHVSPPPTTASEQTKQEERETRVLGHKRISQLCEGQVILLPAQSQSQ